MFRRIISLSLVLALALALTGALAAQKIKKLDYEWFALEDDGTLCVTLRNEGKAVWRYASESSMGGAVEEVSSETASSGVSRSWSSIRPRGDMYRMRFSLAPISSKQRKMGSQLMTMPLPPPKG